MAKRSTRTPARAPVGASRTGAARPAVRAGSATSERIANWLLEHSALIAGSLLACIGVALAFWVSSAAMPLADARATVLGVFGGGVYLLATVVVWIGTLLIRSRSGVALVGRSELRRVLGLTLIGVGLWGAVGAAEPIATLGGVRMETHGAGGQIGAMLDSTFGWIMIAAGWFAAIVLLAPGMARDGLNEIREAGRIARSDIREQGPGVVAASGRATWHGFSTVVGALETGTVRGARGLSRSVGRLAGGRWLGEMNVNGAGGPLAAGPRAIGTSSATNVTTVGHSAVAATGTGNATREEPLGRSTALASPAPLHSDLRAGFGSHAAHEHARLVNTPGEGLRPWVAAAPQSARPTPAIAPDSVLARARDVAVEQPPPSLAMVQDSATKTTVEDQPPVSLRDAHPASEPTLRSPTPTTTQPAGTRQPTSATKASRTRRRERADDASGRTSADGWRLPPVDLLEPDPTASLQSGAEDQARIIVETLASFGVDAAVTQINEGPTITQFGVEPGWEIKTRQVAVKDRQGQALRDEEGRSLMREEEVSRTRVRVNKITRLADDLALALAAPSIRIEAPVPGQPIVGVEVPNADTHLVSLRGLVESPEFAATIDRGGLPIALGRDVTGGPVITDLTKMPHVLIAGATGSGKSVCINTIISSLLMNKSPEQVRLILVDPKRVELTGYGAVPHLAFSHVVTEPDEVVSVLGVVVAEMDRRYRVFERSGARNIAAYNDLPTTGRSMPYWVVVLDELADMMMAAPVDVERQLVRLAQLARAVGIHLVVATQRPSVDVVTGLIKANFPTRIAFATTSQTDARVIMDRAGAEKLMGRGDMLYMSSDAIKPRRVQGSYVSDQEIERLIAWWTSPGQAEADRRSLDDMLEALSESTPEAAATIEERNTQADLDALQLTLTSALAEDEDDRSEEQEEPDIVPEVETELEEATPTDTRLDEAIQLAREYERVSATLLQRRMRVGRPRAKRLIDELERAGVVAKSDGGQSRRVLVGRGRSI